MKILPIKELRNTNKFLNLCNESNGPFLITKNKYNDMPVMSIKIYEEKLEKIEMYGDILEGLTNLKDGKIKDGIYALNDLKAKYKFS